MALFLYGLYPFLTGLCEKSAQSLLFFERPPVRRILSVASRILRLSEGVRALSISRVDVTGNPLIFSTGLPRGKGLSLWIHFAQVLRCARILFQVLIHLLFFENLFCKWVFTEPVYPLMFITLQ